MTLNEYLDKESLPMSKMSRETGIPIDTLNKYKYGIRIPKPKQMRVIFEVTQGEVDANSFYHLREK